MKKSFRVLTEDLWVVELNGTAYDGMAALKALEELSDMLFLRGLRWRVSTWSDQHVGVAVYIKVDQKTKEQTLKEVSDFVNKE